MRAILLLSLLLGVTHAAAVEKITRFESDIVVEPTGELLITESISVIAEGKQIRRGIYRDFPTEYKDRYGHDVSVTFEVVSTLRNDSGEDFHTERRANGVRVYLGSADRMLEPGEHHYRLQYRTRFQLGFFEDFDELYYNVTGNGWVFPIERAQATVTLPQPVPAEQLRIAAYTGPQGSTATDYTHQITADGRVQFATTQPLGSYEGLTIAVGFPKGLVAEPTAADRAGRFFRDNIGVLVGTLATIGVLVLYVSAWRRVGKDPAKGIIIPRYEAPGGYSPASLRYILKMGYDTTCLAAALVNLAVKDYIRIEQKKGFFSKKFTIHRTDGGTADLAPGESTVLSKLLGGRSSFKFDDKNHRTVQSALAAHKRVLSNDFNKKYFILNGSWLALGWLGSIVAVVLMAVLGAFPSVAAIALTIVLLITNIVFSIIMKAPTLRGRKVMDEIEGLKLYLGVAERQDLERQKEPPQTFEEFEKFLPYAVALDCASTWADRFKSVLAQLEQSGELRQRGWYTGAGHMSAANMVSSVNALSSGLSSNISSASSPPGSSSGSGGGGSSGGGGGGGGGGGW